MITIKNYTFLIILTILSISISYGQQDYFITKWKTDNKGKSCDSCIEIPTNFNSYNYDIDWDNDGVFDDFGVEGTAVHDYGIAGEYVVAIKGDFPAIFFDDFDGQGESHKILEIMQWGNNTWSSFNRAFRGCKNLQITATDTPDLSLVRTMNYMFEYAESINFDLNSWDVSNVETMVALFSNATSFNGDISDWDVSNVISIQRMFYRAHAFNKEISQWDVSNVTDMSRTFQEALAFNQNISQWDVSNVIDMSSMLSSASSFNQNLNNWNVSNVIDLSDMFRYASSFNQDLNNWDLSNVEDLSFIFGNAQNFNGNVTSWDVSMVKKMSGVFNNAVNFTGDISQWDIGNVEKIDRMFSGATLFNSDVGQWDVSNVSTMFSIFKNASSFNYSLSNWNLNSVEQDVNVSGLHQMLDNCGMTPSTYQSTLDGWAFSNSIPQGLNLDSEGLFYCSDESRNILIQNDWDIEGDEKTDDLSVCVSSSLSENTNPSIKINPNPCNNYITIESPFNILENAHLISINGEFIDIIELNKGRNKISVKHLLPGMYLLQVINEENNKTLKFIKL